MINRKMPTSIEISNGFMHNWNGITITRNNSHEKYPLRGISITRNIYHNIYQKYQKEKKEEYMGSDEENVVLQSDTKKKKLIIIAAAVAVVIAIVAIVTVVLNNDSHKIAKLLDAGNRYLDEQNYDEAVVAFNGVLEIDPMNADAYLGVADAYEGLGDHEKAIAAIEKGQEMLGDDFAEDRLAELKEAFKKAHNPHKFSEATCTEGEICEICEAEGEKALGHDLSVATCTEPAKCSRCDYVEGTVGEHEWEEATFQHPKQCSKCGATEGEAVKGDFESHGIVIEPNIDEVFEGVFNGRSEYISYTGLNYKAWTSDYMVIKSDADHPAKDGYVWQLITVNIIFGAYNDGKPFEYWGYGSAREDYYSTKLADDTIDYKNRKYDGSWKGDYYITTMNSDATFNIIYDGEECEAHLIMNEVSTESSYFGVSSFKGFDCSPQYIQAKYAFCVPEGYDGNVATFYLTSDMVWKDGEYFYDVYRDDNHKDIAIVYRLPEAKL